MKRLLLCFLLTIALPLEARGKRYVKHHHTSQRPKGPCAQALSGLNHKSQELQNKMILEDDLLRVLDDRQLEWMKEEGLLVAIKKTSYLRLDKERDRHGELRWDPKFRFCRPWTAEFLDDFAAAYFHEFGEAFQVDSAVRTIVYQHELRRSNKNAALVFGNRASSHPAGATVDITKKGMSDRELFWMRQTLCELKSLHLIEAIEEFKQGVFHIMVFKAYTKT